MDPVADALIRIKNGYAVGKMSVDIRYSKLILRLMEVLSKGDFIGTVHKKGQLITVELLYKGRKPAISGISRVSKPSLRIYKGVKELPRVLNGLGAAIISTPKGLMTDQDARKHKVGGEVLALVW